VEFVNEFSPMSTLPPEKTGMMRQFYHSFTSLQFPTVDCYSLGVGIVNFHIFLTILACILY